MNGFLLDENLPQRLRFTPSKPVRHVRDLGVSLTDPEVWEFARANDLVVITKDADFSDRILVSEPPPKVVRLRIGNMRLAAFHSLLATRWPTIESLLKDHKLVTVYIDRFEAVSSE
jgi:predicted nuclease of predicted toxin-antitoxin system